MYTVQKTVYRSLEIVKKQVFFNLGRVAMTILPKKKAEQQKDSDNEQSSDHSASPHGASGHASHSSPHPLESPYEDSFSPHHHRGSPETFYHRSVGLSLSLSLSLSSSYMYMYVHIHVCAGIPHTVAKLAICYCIIHFGY